MLRAHASCDSVAANQDIGMLHASAGELDAHTALVLVNALEIPAGMIVRFVDGRAQEALQAVPGAQDLPQRPLIRDAALAVYCDALGHLDAEHFGYGAARLQRFHELGVSGDARAAPDQFDIRTLVDVDVPTDLPQECCGKKSRHVAANNDSPSIAAARRSPRHGANHTRPCPAVHCDWLEWPA